MTQFTAAAQNLLSEHGIAADDYGGEATGADGQVKKSDAEAWLESPEGVVRRFRRRCLGPLVDGERTGCGYPINDLILRFPMDGEPKEADCPGCGRTVRWTPEDFESE